MDPFNLVIDFKSALELFIFLRDREADISGPSSRLYDGLRSYLYARLSIEEMEEPEALLDSLNRVREER